MWFLFFSIHVDGDPRNESFVSFFETSIIHNHALTNFIDTKAKCRHTKNLTCKGLRQVFVRVYRLDMQSIIWYFRPSFVNCLPSLLLSGSIPPPSLCEYWISKHLLYCVRGRGVRGSGPRQINTAAESLYVLVNFLDDDILHCLFVLSLYAHNHSAFVFFWEEDLTKVLSILW